MIDDLAKQEGSVLDDDCLHAVQTFPQAQKEMARMAFTEEEEIDCKDWEKANWPYHAKHSDLVYAQSLED